MTRSKPLIKSSKMRYLVGSARFRVVGHIASLEKIYSEPSD